MSTPDMRTDSLIKALAADAAAPARLSLRWALVLAAIPAAIVSFGLLLASVGIRPDLIPMFLAGPVAYKLVVTLTLTGSALLLSFRASRPDEDPQPAFYVLPAIVLILCGIVFEVVATRSGVDARSLGNTPAACVSLILLCSVPPLAAAFFIMRRGAARRPAAAGAAAGLLAAGIGASIYALHCPNDDAVYVGLWYGLAVAVAAGIGAMLGRRLLNW